MSRHAMTECYCPSSPTFHPDFEFEDETGFVCTRCDSNVFYLKGK